MSAGPWQLRTPPMSRCGHQYSAGVMRRSGEVSRRERANNTIMSHRQVCDRSYVLAEAAQGDRLGRYKWTTARSAEGRLLLLASLF